MNPELEATGKTEEITNEIAQDCIRAESYIPQAGICQKFGEYQAHCQVKNCQPDYIGFQLWLQGAQ